MKTLKSLLFATLLMVSSTFAAKADEPVPFKLSKNYAVNAYVDAVCSGKVSGLNDALDANVKFSMLQGSKVVTFDKAEVLAFMKDNANVKQNCTTKTTIEHSNADVTVVRVDMKYENFVRSNYVTMANTGSGWKITNVYSVFK